MRRTTVSAAIAVFALASPCFPQDAAADSLLASGFQLFSRAEPQSVVSQALAGAGSAMPLDGFEGLVNPALTNAAPRAAGAFAAGFGRSPAFDGFTLPVAAVFADKSGSGMMGFYYRYLSGAQGFAHDAVLNLAGTAAGQIDAQGAVEFGLNMRYEHSVWRHERPAADSLTADFRGRSLLLDIGFYQPHVAPGLDFSLVVTNLTGYVWKDVDGKAKRDGWLEGRYRTIIVGALYALPISGNDLILRIPLDFEAANLFKKSAPNKYIARMGADLQILRTYRVRFGYAYAPEDPLDLFYDFDFGHLFFGGGGVSAGAAQFDFFAGKGEFGVTATYRY